jgi:NhaA family Na+:H+ antiporter
LSAPGIYSFAFVTKTGGMIKRLANPITEFLQSEASGGILLMASALLALVVANSPLAAAYFDVLHIKLGGLSLAHWVNDGLMAVFFLLVGLEMKRELMTGELSTWPRRLLPAVAAIGGMAVPALVYVWVNRETPQFLGGWAIPAATDIAFALGILSLLGKRVPASLKIFLAALAILDDLGAVIIIALFYTGQLNASALATCMLITLALVALNGLKVKRLLPYLVLGAALWWFMLQSGVHATIAGVVLALTIPHDDSGHSPLETLEHRLNKPVAFGIVPLFGFANAGVSLGGGASLANPVTLGIALGLFLGKQVGVFGATLLALKLKVGERPQGASLIQIYGVSLLCGIGFTMSLFIGILAFPDEGALADQVKIGVLAGSLASAICGAAVLLIHGRKQAA